MPHCFRHPGVLLFWATISMLFTLASGCSSNDQDGTTTTQVAARVNGDEITVHQINNVLERNRNAKPEASDEAKRQILDRLIDRQLAMQKAIENELDRSPKVMQAIEAAKNEILARAYLEQVAERTPQRYDWDLQNKEQITNYYSAHPELFAQRRVFTIDELSFVAKSDIAAGMRKHVSQSRTLQEIADWLTSRNIKFAAKRSVRAAEQLSLKHLPQVHAMKQGQIALFELGNDRFQVVRVAGFKEAPIDKERATPRIAQYLSNRQTRDFLATEMKRIRDEAQIEYLGEFAGTASELVSVRKPENSPKETVTE